MEYTTCNELKEIYGFEGKYSINRFGQIYSHPRKYKPKGSWIKPHKNQDNSLTVMLYENDFRYYYSLHHLVAEYFCEKPENMRGKVKFKDGDRSNCNADNLYWV